MEQSREIFRMRTYQREPRLARLAGQKRFLTMWHRRAGKDRSWLAFTLEEMLKRTGVYFHVFPSLNQGRRDMWDNVIQERRDGVEKSMRMISMFPEELIAGKDESEMQITFKTGSVWQVMGADTDEAVDRLRGPNPIGIVFSEYAHGTKMQKAWETLSPVLAENGGWAAFAYTPDGPNHGQDLYNYAVNDKDWFCQKLTVDDTKRDAMGEDGSPVIPLTEIEALRKQGQREEFIAQEYYCSFTGFQHGTIYGDLIAQARHDNHIGLHPYVPQLPVGTIWDLGHTDATAVWFYQRKNAAITFIDYHEESQKGLQWWARYLREDKQYIYGRMVLPWDGHAAEEYFSTVGFRNIEVCKRPPSLQAEIEQVRRAFSMFYFDESHCHRGLECLTKYKRKYDDTLRVFIKNPVHDEYSHGADALRTGVAGGFDPLEFIVGASQSLKVESEFDPREAM